MTCPRCGAVLLVRRTTATTWGHVVEERYECGYRCLVGDQCQVMWECMGEVDTEELLAEATEVERVRREEV